MHISTPRLTESHSGSGALHSQHLSLPVHGYANTCTGKQCCHTNNVQEDKVINFVVYLIIINRFATYFLHSGGLRAYSQLINKY